MWNLSSACQGAAAMFRDVIEEIVEVIGPIALKVLAAAACLVVFAPLVAAIVAPIFN